VRGAGVGGRRIERGAVGRAAPLGSGEDIVDIQHQPGGAVLAEALAIVLGDDRDGADDVSDLVAGEAVEVDLGDVEFAAEAEAPLLVPAERRAVVAEFAGEGARSQAV